MVSRMNLRDVQDVLYDVLSFMESVEYKYHVKNFELRPGTPSYTNNQKHIQEIQSHTEKINECLEYLRNRF